VTKLLLVDFENIHRLDTSGLDAAFQVVVFVGADQKPPRLGKEPPRKPTRPEIRFQRVDGYGRNSLDFHIAFYLGRIYETARDTACYVLSKDKGFDPLLRHLNHSGLQCCRIDSIYDLEPPVPSCARCGNKALHSHNDGLWCPICGAFVVDPDPRYTAHTVRRGWSTMPQLSSLNSHICAYCHQHEDMSNGIYDDGEWMCGHCVAGYAV
jgi:ribosomal protein L37AE/L43A